MSNTFDQSGLEQSRLELIVDQLEELVVTIIEEIRERPGVAVAVLAGVVGAVIGLLLASGGRGRHAAPHHRVARHVGHGADLIGLGMGLLQNPIVRAYLVSAVAGIVKRRLSR
jgi:hypothetical protein